ncbi:hypothetical protein [Alteromonas mediterranea]|uniref:Uncharacterized protein n=1 Tax=Alteromonas mediterranea (strain DSM 17117 / CIP 110805 / LMG 28347 / Deep ecotype) TaxID=1774373 RepID=F2GB78_ALTMD|nr:hypothetical protein [Alteromonas mediterranea]AEA97984.1 hypothetical protein MADE_1009230 [Alteromonas mediterranea DE]AGP85562.1 hypothetical protein I607_08835 [Alteromonas mediterranea U4]AGP89690.1 hypothetical protein I876_09135 [Alteromonas mediterranea U7]
MTNNRRTTIIRLFLLVSTIISLFFVPWILVKAWILPLPQTVQVTKQDRHISFLGLREIHQKHLIADLVFLINELKTTLRIFLYFSVGYGLEL